MLTPRYEADDKGDEDGGECYGEAFLALLCLANHTVVSNTLRSCMVVMLKTLTMKKKKVRQEMMIETKFYVIMI